MKAMVYWNLHKLVWSVKNRNLPVAHARCLELSNCEFRVRRCGRERVLLERRKNVHSFVVGTVELIVEVLGPVKTDGMVQVTYNPYKYATFVRCDTLAPIKKADRVVMVCEDGRAKVLALNPV